MFIEIKLSEHCVGAWGWSCSLGGEAHLVNFHRARERAITLSSFVNGLTGLTPACLLPGPLS